jgi:hypothetical protein
MKIKQILLLLTFLLFFLFINGCNNNYCGDGICSNKETLDNCKSDCEINIDDIDFSTNMSVFASISGHAIYDKKKCSVQTCSACSRIDLCNNLKSVLINYHEVNKKLDNLKSKLIKYPDSVSKDILIQEISIAQNKLNDFIDYYYPINLDTLSSDDFAKGKLDVSNMNNNLSFIKKEIVFFIKHGTLCGNSICNQGETVDNCPEDCFIPGDIPLPYCGDNKCELGEFETCDIDCGISPFGIHGSYGKTNYTNNLRSSTRTMAKYSLFKESGISTSINKLDKNYLNNNYGMVVSFVSDEERIDQKYYLLDENSLIEWKKIVYHIVERYDGDSDFGCLTDNGQDCYTQGDSLYPEKELRDKILTRPIKHWQIENEWTWQIYDKETQKKANVEDLVTHMSKISFEIKQADPDSKILMSGFSGLDLPLLHHQKEGYIVRGFPDCNYSKRHYDNLTVNEKKAVEEEYNKTLYLIKNAADYYDIIDFHFYIKNDLEVVVNFTEFLDNILKENNLTDKEYWSLESASPFYFFNLLPGPSIQKVPDCKYDICKQGYYDTIYDENIHSEHLIKMYMFGLSSGIKKIFYSTLWPTCEWSENFVRLSLLDLDNNKKLPYYTYKLMTDKLFGYESLERIYLSNNDSNDYIYEAKVANKSVFIAWTKSQNHSIDMRDYIQGTVNITTLIIDKTSNKRIIKTTKSSDIEISNSPIFIEEATKQEEPTVCPQDVRICPDGSFVSRNPPGCEFADC